MSDRGSGDLRAWMDARRRAAPEALSLPDLELGDGEADRPEGLTTAGLAALERALEGAGERDGAFDLLAADALLTWACEWAAASRDPERALGGVVERVARKEG